MASEADRRARFEAVAELVYEPLQRYLRRRVPAEDVSELLDDTLLVLWRRLADVPSDDPLAWSYGVARRCVANHRRGEQRRLRLVRRLETRADRSPDHAAPTTDGQAALWEALDELDEAERELVRLWAWEQLEPHEIAIVLASSPNAISLRLTRVKAKIRSTIERQNDGVCGQEQGGHRKEHRT